MRNATQKPDHRTCDARRCRWCHRVEILDGTLSITDDPRGLTTDDLAWYFGEGEAAVSAPSSQAAFEHMLTVGPPAHGGRSNGVEERAVEQRRLDATGRHRCIRARLAEVAPSVMEVLRASYGPTDWTRSIDEPQARAAIARATSLLEVAAVRLMPLTQRAKDGASRRQAAQTRPRPRKPHPPAPGRPRAADQHERLREWVAAQPGLAASPVGVALVAVTAGGVALRDLLADARALLRDALAAVGAVEPQARRRIRSVQLAPRPSPPPAPEYIERRHAEALAGG